MSNSVKSAIFHPIQSRKVFQEAVSQIAEAIRVGDVRVGDRLPSERALASQLGISRPTVREAIKVLVDAGVIHVNAGPGGGMFVKSDAVSREFVDSRAPFKVGEVDAVLEARRVLEPRVAQLASLYGSEEDFELMQKTIDQQKDAIDDRRRFILLDLRFHLTMAKASKNWMIVALMKLLLKELEILRDMATREPGEPEMAIEIHERTLRAIRRGHPDEIEAAMDEHLTFLEVIWEEVTGRPRLRRVPEFLVSRSAGRPESQ